MSTYTIQPLSTGLMFMAIPLAACAFLWLIIRRRVAYYQRKYSGWRLRWALWGGPLLISLVSIVPFYYFLFWVPFYAITIRPDVTWTLAYHLPGREISLDPAEIVSLETVDDNIPAIIDNNRPRQSLLVITRGGAQYQSVLMPREEAQILLGVLQAQLR